MTSTRRLLLAAALLGAVAVPFALADKWEPYKFQAPERYDYRVETKQGEETVEIFYTIELKDSGKKNPAGEPLTEVAYTTRHLVPSAQLGQETALGSMGMASGGYLAIFLMNPFYSMIFQQMDLAVGEKMSLFGAGTVKVTEETTVGGRKGFVCQFFQPNSETGKEVMAAEWVVDPKLALPLRSRMYEQGAVAHTMELVSYTGR